jgi:deazaflavin-dependent oxidoreductase (nitroreductase family)
MVRSMTTMTTSVKPHGAADAASETLPASIRLLRRLKPLMVALLRSPLHRVLSRDLLLLSYVGAKSGRRLVLPLSYIEVDGHVYLCTRSSLWWRNLRANRDVEIHLRGRRVAASAHVVDPESSEARAGFRAFITRNPRTGEMLYDVRAGADGRPVEEDLEREVVRSVVVRLELQRAAG